MVYDDDAVPHFPGVYGVPNMAFGPYHHGVEAFYSEPATSQSPSQPFFGGRLATSVYSERRECHGKPYNEDVTCSFSEITRSFERHKNYFGIPVGTFWEKRCVHSTRKKREMQAKYNNTLERDRCSKYNTKEARSSSARARSFNMFLFGRSLCCFMVFFISTAL